MANKIIQLKNNDGDKLYPISTSFTDNKIWVPDYENSTNIFISGQNQYTMSEDGFLSIAILKYVNSGIANATVKVNNVLIAEAQADFDYNSNKASMLNEIIPVRKGDEIELDYSSSASHNSLKFIPGKWVSAPKNNSSTKNLVDLFYPVGSYYETSDTTFNPNTAWGGTWVEDTKGRVTVSKSDSGTFATMGATGGAETHTLTVNEMPKHKHSPVIHWPGTQKTEAECFTTDSYVYNANKLPVADYVQTMITNTGGDAAHNNLQPYVVVKRWHRTA